MISRPRMLNEPPGSGLLSRIATVIVYVLASFLLALLILNLYFSRNYMFTRVDGRSMQNTLQNNDWLYTDTRAAAERVQVVIIDVTDYPDKYKPDKDNADQERSIIKRLIAVEGDCVKCEYGIVYVKYAGGEYRALEEDYAYGTTRDFKEVEVGEGEIFFLGDNRYFQATIIWTDIWKGFGFGTIVYLAAITGIDQSLYEAATMDGAGRFRKMWHITLPGMRMIIVLMAVLSLGNILNAGFDQIWNLISPQVYETGDVIDTFIYRIGMIDAQFGPATAMGVFKSAVSCFFISVSYYLAYKLFDYRVF